MQTITVESTINAPVAQVWTLWTSPEHIKKLEYGFRRLAYNPCRKRFTRRRQLFIPDGSKRRQLRF